MRRATPVLAALVALAVSAPAHATTCPIVTDPAGDSAFRAGLGAASLDILSADVASGATTVVAVLRVRSLALEPSSLAPQSWSVGFRIAGTGYYVSAERRALAYSAYLGVSGTRTTSPATLTVDETASTLTWTVPRASFPELASPGAVFDQINAITYGWFLPATDAAGYYTAASPNPTWTDGTTPCVPAA